MIVMLVRLALAKLLTDPSVKKAVMAELKTLVDDPESKWDDTFLELFEDGWDAVVPVIAAGKG